MAITDYRTSSDNSNGQQQPMASYRQTSELLPVASQLRRVKNATITEYTCDNSTRLTLFLLLYAQAMV